MFGRGGHNLKSNVYKQSERKGRRKKPDRRQKGSQKGRGKRARETIRETSPVRSTGKQQPKTKTSGPPLKIGGGQKKQTTGITPESVIRINRGGRRK